MGLDWIAFNWTVVDWGSYLTLSYQSYLAHRKSGIILVQL